VDLQVVEVFDQALGEVHGEAEGVGHGPGSLARYTERGLVVRGSACSPALSSYSLGAASFRPGRGPHEQVHLVEHMPVDRSTVPSLLGWITGTSG
jgi:hypothetical protein